MAALPAPRITRAMPSRGRIYRPEAVALRGVASDTWTSADARQVPCMIAFVRADSCASFSMIGALTRLTSSCSFFLRSICSKGHAHGWCAFASTAKV
jgi:hypothetical protein